MKQFLFLFALLTCCYQPTFAQSALQKQLDSIASSKKAEIKAAITLLEAGETVSIRGNEHAPMMSVFKFHIALTVLHEVDKGTFKLDQLVKVRKKELIPNTWSPIAKVYPKGGEIPLSKILRYTVSESDNNGCDILLRLLGGPAKVEAYMQSTGMLDVGIGATEADMHRDRQAIFTNWTSPLAANQLLRLFYEKKLLSESSYAFLWKAMVESTTGPMRLRGQLPEGTVVADKTGTSGTTDEGLTDAVNDIGIILLPDGRTLIVSVFVCNSLESFETNEQIIAEIAKAAWDYYTMLPGK